MNGWDGTTVKYFSSQWKWWWFEDVSLLYRSSSVVKFCLQSFMHILISQGIYQTQVSFRNWRYPSQICTESKIYFTKKASGPHNNYTLVKLTKNWRIGVKTWLATSSLKIKSMWANPGIAKCLGGEGRFEMSLSIFGESENQSLLPLMIKMGKEGEIAPGW